MALARRDTYCCVLGCGPSASSSGLRKIAGEAVGRDPSRLRDEDLVETRFQIRLTYSKYGKRERRQCPHEEPAHGGVPKGGRSRCPFVRFPNRRRSISGARSTNLPLLGERCRWLIAKCRITVGIARPGPRPSTSLQVVQKGAKSRFDPSGCSMRSSACPSAERSNSVMSMVPSPAITPSRNRRQPPAARSRTQNHSPRTWRCWSRRWTRYSVHRTRRPSTGSSSWTSRARQFPVPRPDRRDRVIPIFTGPATSASPRT